MTGRNFTQTTIQLIKDLEDFRPNAYPDGRAYSIGYGSQTYENGVSVKAGDTITEARATQLLTFHVGRFAQAVNNTIRVQLSQNQFDALVSFAYNVGAGAFSGSTLARVVNINPNNIEGVVTEFRKWVFSQGVKIDGLVNRREAEILVYVQATYTKKNFNLILAAAAVLVSYLIFIKK